MGHNLKEDMVGVVSVVDHFISQVHQGLLQLMEDFTLTSE
jgi:hypothetical protein